MVSPFLVQKRIRPERQSWTRSSSTNCTPRRRVLQTFFCKWSIGTWTWWCSTTCRRWGSRGIFVLFLTTMHKHWGLFGLLFRRRFGRRPRTWCGHESTVQCRAMRPYDSSFLTCLCHQSLGVLVVVYPWVVSSLITCQSHSHGWAWAWPSPKWFYNHARCEESNPNTDRYVLCSIFCPLSRWLTYHRQ